MVAEGLHLVWKLKDHTKSTDVLFQDFHGPDYLKKLSIGCFMMLSNRNNLSFIILLIALVYKISLFSLNKELVFIDGSYHEKIVYEVKKNFLKIWTQMVT